MRRYFLEFALASLSVERFKNFFTFLILFFILFVLSCVFFISSSLKFANMQVISQMPDIIVQKRWAGRAQNMPMDRMYKLLDIEGVSNVIPRIWGMYRFDKAGVNFSVIGIDPFDYDYMPPLHKTSERFANRELQGAMIVGKGVKKVLKDAYYTNYFNFLLPDGSIKKMRIADVFSQGSILFSNDVMVMSVDDARGILQIPQGYVSDFALFVTTKEEIATTVRKIEQLFPDSHLITKEEMRATFERMFDYKSGFFLLLYTVVFVAFSVIVIDRLSGMSQSQRKEIAVLKSIGWSIRDIIKLKFTESFIIAFGAYFSAIVAALFFVYFLQAPLLRDIFTGFDTLKPPLMLEYHLSFSTYALLFLFSVPIYMASVIVPAWRVAVIDVDEVLR